MGWIAGLTGASFFVGTLIETLIATNIPDYAPQPYQGTMLLWAMLLTCVLLNTVFSRFLPLLEIFILVFA